MKDHEVTLRLNYPHIDADVELSPHDIRYLRTSGVALIGQTVTALEGVRSFVNGFGIDKFDHFLNDQTPVAHGTLLSMFSGKLCYMALGEAGTQKAQAKEYIGRIKSERHGSVLEHPTYTFLIYGIDRAVTHEWVRHRVGKAYSQLSQRFVGPDKLRFCMPMEHQGDEEMENVFFEDILANRDAYQRRIELISKRRPDLPGESKTDKRKRFQSAARRVLANEVEAPIVISGNARAWRHVLTKRMAKGADIGIRRPSGQVLRILQRVAPETFDDFAVSELPDGSLSAIPEHEAV